MPEGKEGGASFQEKRPPRFWSLRQREAEMRGQLVAEYEEKDGED
jgi:naphthoate synthase/2-ketocyclohexanecarboxyl-CoA hydrolase